jgi:hypothetical protein
LENEILRHPKLSFQEKELLIFLADYIQDNNEKLYCNLFSVENETELFEYEVLPVVEKLEKSGFITSQFSNSTTFYLSLNHSFLMSFIEAKGELYYV